MSGPKALQLLRDVGGRIRSASWKRAHYWILAPWGGNGGEETLLHVMPTRDDEGHVLVPAIVRAEDLRATDFVHEIVREEEVDAANLAHDSPSPAVADDELPLPT